MAKKINYGKISVVILLTILVWVWTDLALDEEFSVSGEVISVSKSTNPNLWASFNAGESDALIQKLILKGQASRVAEVKRKLKTGMLSFEFFLDPEQQAITGPGEYPLNVADFLRQSDQIRQLGLVVVSCEPEQLTVSVAGLVKRLLKVKCVDSDQIQIKDATIKPAQVEMFVPDDWQGEKLTADVQLSRSEINQARVVPVTKRPYIKLTPGQNKEAGSTVQITILPQEDPLSDYTITGVTLGIALSPALQGKYDVQISNLDAVISSIAIRATLEAKQAYERMRYQVMLEIDDEDVRAEDTRRELVYNFPDEWAGSSDIILNQQPITARFKLVAISEQAQ